MYKEKFRKAVLLGKTYGVETPYYQLAKKNELMCFYNKNYDKLVKRFGSELMNEANMKFIFNQMVAGKHIIFAHDIITGVYKEEIKYVTKICGYKNISYWHLL